MTKRDYEQDPIVVEFKVRVFVYEEISNDDLITKLENTVNNSGCQEEVFNAVMIADNMGLDEFSYTITSKR